MTELGSIDIITQLKRHQEKELLRLVVVGSVARGDARPDSDVDVYLVVTDEAYSDALWDELVKRAAILYRGVDLGIVLVHPSGPRHVAKRAPVSVPDLPTVRMFIRSCAFA